MNKIKTWLKAEFLNGQTKADWIFMAIGIALQILAICMTVKNPGDMTSAQIFWAAVSGLTGIVSVVLCAQGKISFYVFGFIQLFSYVFAVAIPWHLWGEVFENIFYFVTMIIGMVIWLKNYKKTDKGEIKVEAKKLTARGWIISVAALVITTVGLGLFLMYAHNWIPFFEPDPTPWLDALTTTAPFIAQIFLMLSYRDQWAFWIIEDVTSVVMFVILGDWIMLAQYVFWTINCVYGWYKWSKAE